MDGYTKNKKAITKDMDARYPKKEMTLDEFMAFWKTAYTKSCESLAKNNTEFVADEEPRIKVVQSYSGVSFKLHGKRLETDAEFKRRVTAAEKAKEIRRIALEKKEKEERELLAKLKAKYEE